MAERSSGLRARVSWDLHLGNVVLLEARPHIRRHRVQSRAALHRRNQRHGLRVHRHHGSRSAAARLALRQRLSAAHGRLTGLPLLASTRSIGQLVRAKVALIRLRQPQLSHHVRLRQHMSFEHYLALAERLRGQGASLLAAMTGLSGSGKSTVRCVWPSASAASGSGRRRAQASVRLRIIMASGAASTRRKRNARTYATWRSVHRRHRARVPVIIDAASLRRDERLAPRPGAQLGANFALIVCSAPTEVLRARVAARAAAGTDPSEADLAVLERNSRGTKRPGPTRSVGHHVDTAQGLARIEANCDRLGTALLAAAATDDS